MWMSGYKIITNEESEISCKRFHCFYAQKDGSCDKFAMHPPIEVNEEHGRIFHSMPWPVHNETCSTLLGDTGYIAWMIEYVRQLWQFIYGPNGWAVFGNSNEELTQMELGWCRSGELRSLSFGNSWIFEMWNGREPLSWRSCSSFSLVLAKRKGKSISHYLLALETGKIFFHRVQTCNDKLINKKLEYFLQLTLW